MIFLRKGFCQATLLHNPDKKNMKDCHVHRVISTCQMFLLLHYCWCRTIDRWWTQLPQWHLSFKHKVFWTLLNIRGLVLYNNCLWNHAQCCCGYNMWCLLEGQLVYTYAICVLQIQGNTVLAWKWWVVAYYGLIYHFLFSYVATTPWVWHLWFKILAHH